MDLFTIARKDGSGAILWSEDQTRFIIHEYQENNNTLNAIAQMFKTRPESIRALLRKNNIEIIDKHTRFYPRDSNFFHVIDAPQKAYWLGMFYADGTVSSKTNQISLTLKDLEHVEKFRAALKAVNKIVTINDKRFTKPCLTYEFSIHDQQLHQDLITNGVLPNKSYLSFGLPQINDVNLMRHFIRGYFDGDGGISYKMTDEPGRAHFSVSFTGNFQFLTELKQFLNCAQISLSQNCVSKITYNFSIGGRLKVLSFLNWLYQDATEDIRLDRKYQSYLTISAYQVHRPRTRTYAVWPTI